MIIRRVPWYDDINNETENSKLRSQFFGFKDVQVNYELAFNELTGLYQRYENVSSVGDGEAEIGDTEGVGGVVNAKHLFSDNNYSATNYSRCFRFGITHPDLTVDVVGIVLGLLGLLCNILIVVTLTRMSRLRKSTKILLLVISFNDIVYILAYSLQTYLKEVIEQYGSCSAILGLAWSQIFFFFLHNFTQTTKVWTVVLLAGERCLSIYHPFRVNVFFKPRRVVLMVVGVVVGSAIVSAPHCVNFEMIALEEIDDLTKCRKIYHCKPFWQYWPSFHLWFNSIVDTSVKFFLPSVALLYLTIALFQGTKEQLRKHRRVMPTVCRLEEVTEQEQCSVSEEISEDFLTKIRRRRRERRWRSKRIVVNLMDKLTMQSQKRRWSVNVMCTALLVTFLICRTPTNAINIFIFSSFGTDDAPVDKLEGKAPELTALSQVAHLFYMLDATLLPILLQISFNPSFRKSLMEIFRTK